jgi:hypothetical protein
MTEPRGAEKEFLSRMAWRPDFSGMENQNLSHFLRKTMFKTIVETSG